MSEIQNPFMWREVIEGRRWLDTNFPGWKDIVDVTKLDLGACPRCIIGQLDNHYGGCFLADIEGLVFQKLREEFGKPFCHELGFELDFDLAERLAISDEEGYQRLTMTWLCFLRERCPDCGQIDVGQTSEWAPCKTCGVPWLWDPPTIPGLTPEHVHTIQKPYGWR
jgi:hypothetical protein